MAHANDLDNRVEEVKSEQSEEEEFEDAGHCNSNQSPFSKAAHRYDDNQDDSSDSSEDDDAEYFKLIQTFKHKIRLEVE